jgi:hypothetical protein
MCALRNAPLVIIATGDRMTLFVAALFVRAVTVL